MIVLALAACGPTAAGVKTGGAAPRPVAHAPIGPQPTPATPGTPAAPATTAAAPDIGCATTTCVFHAGAAAYFTCLSGGAGACFHFGGPCTPADGCMYDPADHTYKQCARAVEGQCAQWASACTPKSACMFDPGDGLHHHCDDAGGGTCRKYGALCAP